MNFNFSITKYEALVSEPSLSLSLESARFLCNPVQLVLYLKWAHINVKAIKYITK
jgi:hypothetical protein